MFNLVSDVERYPEFLPWCVALRIVDRKTLERGELATADMVVAYKVFRERFRSIVKLDRGNQRIDVEYVDGPFRSLKNEWAFRDIGQGGSEVDFAIEFEFRSVLLQATAQAVFEKAFLRMSEAFVERARVVYGAPTSPAA
jgi:coenzyme Q-binding protein COQ10